MNLPALKTPLLRRLVQAGFLGWCVFLGVQFGLFVRHFETFGQSPAYLRPPGVEAFLPIGALASLKYTLTSGRIDPVHPAALVLFVTFLGMTLVAGKAFCSWICPVGTLEEGAGRLGRRLFGRNLRLWKWPDRLLRGLKYLLLLFFTKLILLDMPAGALGGFLASPYWAVADVRMLHFFTSPSGISLAVLTVLALLAVGFGTFWCRYLCPYGALLGLVALPSPLRIRRRPQHCIGCGRCGEGCPGRIEVHRRRTVRSPECSACLGCVSGCPAPDAIGMGPGLAGRVLPVWSFALLVLLLFAAGVGAGMVSGHWESALTYDQYRQLIPVADRLGF